MNMLRFHSALFCLCILMKLPLLSVPSLSLPSHPSTQWRCAFFFPSELPCLGLQSHLLLFIPLCIIWYIFSLTTLCQFLLQVAVLPFLLKCRSSPGFHLILSLGISSFPLWSYLFVRLQLFPLPFWLLPNSYILPWPLFWFLICISNYLLNISSWIIQWFSK